RLDRPREGSRAAVRVARVVDGPRLERMAAVGERRGGVRAGAGREAATVDLALEAGHTRAARVTAGERERRRGVGIRVRGIAGARGSWGGRVHHPGVRRGRGILVRGRVEGLHLERVATGRQAGIALRARAGREAAAVELALEGQAAGGRDVVAPGERE